VIIYLGLLFFIFGLILALVGMVLQYLFFPSELRKMGLILIILGFLVMFGIMLSTLDFSIFSWGWLP